MGQIESEGIVSLKKDLNALLFILSSITIILVFSTLTCCLAVDFSALKQLTRQAKRTF